MFCSWLKMVYSYYTVLQIRYLFGKTSQLHSSEVISKYHVSLTLCVCVCACVCVCVCVCVHKLSLGQFRVIRLAKIK